MADRVKLTTEQAVAMLPDGEYIHTFMNPSGMMLGCEHERQSIIADFEKFGVELSGEIATSMNHGLVYFNEGKAVFVETKSGQSEKD